MKIYKTQDEVNADIKNGLLVINESVTFTFNLSIKASIKVFGNIDAGDIDAENIDACNIDACNIDAGDINACNIDACNIDAWDIKAKNIDAWNILYSAFCCVYRSIFCLSIKAKREKHSQPICLDGKLEINKK